MTFPVASLSLGVAQMKILAARNRHPRKTPSSEQ
jgi:hypothetical protein